MQHIGKWAFILGLALIAFTADHDGFLREGCHLVFHPYRHRYCCLECREQRRLRPGSE